jgi:hypothetical protein
MKTTYDEDEGSTRNKGPLQTILENKQEQRPSTNDPGKQTGTIDLNHGGETHMDVSYFLSFVLFYFG